MSKRPAISLSDHDERRDPRRPPRPLKRRDKSVPEARHE